MQQSWRSTMHVEERLFCSVLAHIRCDLPFVLFQHIFNLLYLFLCSLQIMEYGITTSDLSTHGKQAWQIIFLRLLCHCTCLQIILQTSIQDRRIGLAVIAARSHLQQLTSRRQSHKTIMVSQQRTVWQRQRFQRNLKQQLRWNIIDSSTFRYVLFQRFPYQPQHILCIIVVIIHIRPDDAKRIDLSFCEQRFQQRIVLFPVYYVSSIFPSLRLWDIVGKINQHLVLQQSPFYGIIVNIHKARTVAVALASVSQQFFQTAHPSWHTQDAVRIPLIIPFPSLHPVLHACQHGIEVHVLGRSFRLDDVKHRTFRFQEKRFRHDKSIITTLGKSRLCMLSLQCKGSHHREQRRQRVPQAFTLRCAHIGNAPFHQCLQLPFRSSIVVASTRHIASKAFGVGKIYLRIDIIQTVVAI